MDLITKDIATESTGLSILRLISHALGGPMDSSLRTLRSTGGRALLLALFALPVFTSSAQISGTKTVGGTAPDFPTLKDAVNALMTQGVSGPVVFRVRPGTYTEHFEIGSIAGASATSTVTFDGQVAAQCTVRYSATLPDSNYIIKLVNAGHVVFQHFTFVADHPTYGRSILIQGATHHIEIRSNVLLGAFANDASQDRGIIFCLQQFADSITVSENTFYLGSYGILLSAGGAHQIRGVLILNNEFFANGYAAINLSGALAPIVYGNTVHYTSGYGIWAYVSGGSRFLKNRIAASYCGLYITNTGNSSNRGLLANNFVTARSSGQSWGIHLNSSQYTDVSYNSVHLIDPYAYSYALSVTSSNNVTVLNNNLASHGAGFAYLASPGSGVVSSDYNNIYSAGNQLAYWDANRIDLAALQASSGKDLHSLSVLPHYASDTDLHTVAPWLNGRGLPLGQVGDDIDGEPRNAASPDIGADEFTPDPATLTPLTGTLTVGSGGYSSFNAAVADLELRGVSGPVLVNAATGTYQEHFRVRQIPGASPLNTVTFQPASGDTGDVIISYAANADSLNYVVWLYGADNIQFKKLTLRANGSAYARAFDFFGCADSILVENCSLYGSYSQDAQGLRSLIYSSGSNYRDRKIVGNAMAWSAYGLNLLNDVGTRAEIVGNIIEDIGYAAISINSPLTPLIRGNTIQAGSYGIELWGCAQGLRIETNRIVVGGPYAGIILGGCNGSFAQRGLTANNFVTLGSAGAGSGIRVSGSSYQDIFHNSVNVIAAGSSGEGLWMSSSGNVTVKNNIFRHAGAGYAWFVQPSSGDVLDYNDLVTNGVNLAYWNQNCPTLDSLRSVSGQEAHGLSADPAFASPTDLHSSAAALAGAATPLAEVVDDIDGENRDSSHPDIGADEQAGTLPPESFTEVPTAMTGLRWAAAAFGDYDNDGDLDLLLSGASVDTPMTVLYQNNGGAFLPTSVSFPGISEAAAAWGDYDGDNLLDVCLAGTDRFGTRITRVYRNSGSTFIDIGADLTGVTLGSVAWGDYNNDGRLDLLVAGRTGSLGSSASDVYRNDGSGVFTKVNASLPGIERGSVAWGDYNSDGALDILLAGSGITRIYRNQGDDVFFNTGGSFTGFLAACAAWADYDNDGDPDFVVSGSVGGAPAARLFRNSDGSFDEIDAGIIGVTGGGVAWGDCDNDGWADLAILGGAETELVMRVYRNNADGSFTPMTSSFPGLVYGCVAWGDYNNDRKLDLLAMGQDQSFQGTVRLYRNESPAANTAPSVPGNPLASIAPDFALLQWDASIDAETPQAALTYNVRMGTSPGSSSVISPMSLAGGTRTIPASGNRGQSTRIFVEGLQPGTKYYWAVQAVDNGFAGSSFAVEDTFTTPGSYLGAFSDINAGIPGLHDGTVSWVDFDYDGDLDACVTGATTPDSLIAPLLYRNDLVAFTPVATGIPPSLARSATWTDYDGDGDLDVFIHDDFPFRPTSTFLYRNDGPGAASSWLFTKVTTGLNFHGASDCAWGDYDNDGDLDALMTGYYSLGMALTKLFRNNLNLVGASGDPQFSEAPVSIPQLKGGAAAWGDYDNDGDLDILISGSTDADEPRTIILRNDAGTFTDISAPLLEVTESSVAWVDFDNDRDLDCLITGLPSSGVPRAKVYRNTGGAFSDVNAAIVGVRSGSAACGDYDGDGIADILIAGTDSSGGGLTRLYRGNGSGAFSPVANTSLPDLKGASVAWGDYNSDGRPDILINGSDGTSFSSRIYRNNLAAANTAPSSPTGLVSQVLSATSVRFEWSGSTDAETDPDGLTYNLRVGTSPLASDIVSATALSTGRLLQPGMGNVQENLVWKLDSLKPGTHIYWSVQAIDQGLAGSPFAAEKFTFTPGGPFSVATTLAGVKNSAVAWGDVDNDGDLDILLTGSNDLVGLISRVYRNRGDGTFDPGPELAGVEYGAVAFGDLNNDGFLDLSLGGRAKDLDISWLYTNSSGAWTLSHAFELGKFGSGNSAWVDYDNNGYLDLVVTGVSTTPAYYHNQDGSFSSSASGFFLWGYYGWHPGDLDGDGWIDGLANGRTGSHLCRNLGHPLDTTSIGIRWAFQDIDADLPGWSDCLCDIDNDGLDDVYNSYASAFFRNDGDWHFTEIQTSIEKVYSAAFAWGDCDNDGDKDLLLVGRSVDNGQSVSRIYRNDGPDGSSSWHFTDIGANLVPVRSGSVAWGDCDDDGDLDILLTGESSLGPIAIVYRNNASRQNTPPTAPEGIAATAMTAGRAAFGWSRSTDAETPTQALTYNLRIGRTRNGPEIFPPMALASGRRLVPQSGNTYQKASWRVSGLEPGTYYWSVQSVDNAFAGSAFAQVDSFVVPTLYRNPVITTVSDVPFDQGGKVSVKWLASSRDVGRTAVPYYSIWRAVPQSAGTPTRIIDPGELTEDFSQEAYCQTELNGTQFYWEWLVNQSANEFACYSYTSPTLYDSCAGTSGTHHFMVIAHTPDPSVYYESNVGAGCSVDNLAPSQPQQMAGELRQGSVYLTWQMVPDSDLKQYVIYRRVGQGADSAYGSTADTSFADHSPVVGQTCFYFVCAVDIHGNFSLPSQEISLVITGVADARSGIPAEYVLDQNYPNPFNSSTTIRYGLPQKSNVRLAVYDALGQQIAVLVNEEQEAGFHDVRLELPRLSSGVYFYTLRAGEFTESRRFVLLR